MDIQIAPEPTDDERAAILAALAQEEAECRESARADAALPRRGDEFEPGS